ncbi:MAG: biopolymer transport protein ExbD [Limimaricola cinnabarinus]|jgi:biopolymer transport protein ExbD|uniref:Biopolymer transport protein ExbD/TolR n=1 Tax=Limimaricola cinnabarinus LL-001 TaxID=1337093 RepID=U2Z8D9_9RHOB|nr:biopolymer transporter ExbD [Limimaricola cinnabarinus]GAD57720.1 biopolymer transport protein ExbD/TolR [Limimaricola cinnabarinus LL-001]
MRLADLARPRRRISLTPMIDVVFLLLVFFMLSARFGFDLQLPLNAAGDSAGGGWQGPPRLVSIGPEGVALNGAPLAELALPAALADLVEDRSDTIVLRAEAGTELQRLVTVMQRLEAAGYDRLVLVE